MEVKAREMTGEWTPAHLGVRGTGTWECGGTKASRQAARNMDGNIAGGTVQGIVFTV